MKVEEQENAVIDVNRRKRIENYKKIIIVAIMTMIVLPTILCIFLFIKVSSLQKQINDLTNNKKTEADVNDKEEQDEQKYTGDDAGKSDNEVISGEADTTKPGTPSENSEEKTTEKVTTGNDEIIQKEPYKMWTPEEQQIIDKYAGKGQGKKIYLTFDDGPSIYTEEIVEILNYYGVKATFFVNGRTDEASLKRYKLMADGGHTIGLHSYSHQYSDIYSSVANFEKDLFKISDLIYETTGVKSMYYRFPGGSSNTKTEIPIENFLKYLNDNGYKYFDWNAACGDGMSATVPPIEIVTNVMDDAVRKNTCIALMHDAKSKRTTVDGLPLLIETLLKAGFEICPIDDATPLIQQRVVE